MKTQTFKIQGMACAHCAQTIQDLLSNLNEIEDIEISIADKTVQLTSTAPLSLDQLNQALDNSSYRLKELEV